MWRPFASLAPLVTVLAIPFLLRPKGEAIDENSETVVIVTPHNETIRYEFGRAFREHMRRRGRNVRVDWRNPGGASEVARYLASEYAASFEIYWTQHEGHPYTSYIAGAFANPSVKVNDGGPDPHLERLARATFLASSVGSGLDLLFGGGSVDFVVQAAAGRVVDSGIVRTHPELFGSTIPEVLSGEPLWDREGRWFGACVSGFGIFYNPDALTRRGLGSTPLSFAALATPAFFGQIALADPSKSGTAVKSLEMIIQQEMNRRSAELADEGLPSSSVAERAPSEGWERAMRLIRRLSANARYFTDAASKIPTDVAMGNAEAGMCIDFYGRSEGNEAAQEGPPRLRFVAPRGSTSVSADPIALLRGAPHRELALAFLEFVISIEGQKLWDFQVGTPGGPVRSALRRLPVLPALYEPEYAPFRADPDENPYRDGGEFTYHPALTAPLFRAISFIVRTMCVDTHDELREAYRALQDHGFPPRATALFDDVSMVTYDAAKGTIRETLGSSRPIDEANLANRLVRAFRAQYLEVARLAREGQ